MKRTRILSAAIAATLAVSALTTTAFAAEPVATNGTTEITSESFIPTFEVSVPTGMTFLLNPYGLAVENVTGTKTVIADYEVDGESGWTIENNGEYPVKMSMYAVYETTGSISFLPEDTGTAETTSNWVFLTLKFGTKALPWQKKAPTSWNTEDGGNAILQNIAAGASTALTLTGKSGKGTKDWDSTNAVKITAGYKFEY